MEQTTTPTTPNTSTQPAPAGARPMGGRPPMGGGRPGGFGGGRGPGGPRRFGSKPKEVLPMGLKEKMLDLRRVTRVVAGGKRFRFRATIVLGNGNGKLGIGVAKGLDVQAAIGKAKNAALKNLIDIQLKGRTIPHEVEAKFSAAHVRIKPAQEGHGMKAGGAVRVVLSMAGVKDVTAKCLGRTPNKLTNALATIEALKKLKLKFRDQNQNKV